MVLRYARLQIATRKAAAKPLRWHYTHTTQQARWSPRTRPTAGHRHTLLRPTLPIPDQIRPTSTSLHRPLSRLTFSHSLDALRNAFTYQATRNANKHGQVRTTPPILPLLRSCALWLIELAPVVWHLSLSPRKDTPRSRKSVRARFHLFRSHRTHRRPFGRRRRCAFVVVVVHKGVCLRRPLTRTSAAATEQAHMESCTRHATSAQTRSLHSRRFGSKPRTKACRVPPLGRFRSSRNSKMITSSGSPTPLPPSLAIVFATLCG